jgi:hypothetical protein
VSDLSAPQQSALEQPLIRFAYFIEFYFATLTIRISTLSINVTWGGFEWVGMGSIGAISPIEQSQGTAASALTFELNIVQTEWLALAAGPVSEYRGRDAKMYFCPLDDAFQPLGTPVRCWNGTMDTITSGISGKRDQAKGGIKLKCETSAYGIRRPAALRLNAAQHKLMYPNDTALDRLTTLVGKQFPWLSVRNQKR